MSSLCTQCGKPLDPANPETITVAGQANGEPLENVAFDNFNCFLDWLAAKGQKKIGETITHDLWTLQEGIDKFPPEVDDNALFDGL